MDELTQIMSKFNLETDQHSRFSADEYVALDSAVDVFDAETTDAKIATEVILTDAGIEISNKNNEIPSIDDSVQNEFLKTIYEMSSQFDIKNLELDQVLQNILTERQAIRGLLDLRNPSEEQFRKPDVNK
ncbi:hypothetical protein HK096_009558 [Nowakowskiella sp. JEL0078]|nr:hypothetical protein HK096_009558 [Nowakowskiella sp. JEL0078]